MSSPRLIRLACGVFQLGPFNVVRTDLHRWEVRDRRLPPGLRVLAVRQSAVEGIAFAEGRCNAMAGRSQCSEVPALGEVS